MQIYKGMDIITAQPSLKQRRQVRHHLFGIVPATREYDVAKYRKEALKIIRKAVKRNKVPLFVGGAGLYMSIIIDGIFQAKAQNKRMRKKLYQQAGAYGSRYLYEKLEKIDPEAARKIHPHDTKRIIRALEVFVSTGKPISQLQRQRYGLSDEYAVKVFCLNMERNKLYRRINGRVEEMFKQGIIKEIESLRKKSLSKTASCAIGIRELGGYFDGKYDLDEAKRLIKRNTRHYAKRQLTWFKKDKRIKWIEVNEKEKPQEVTKRLWKELY
jgi:tRNA dimethylallyltransferase